MERITRIKPAPLAFPNGGGLKAMAAKKNVIKEQEIKVAEAKHALELAKINEKHSQKPAVRKPNASSKA